MRVRRNAFASAAVPTLIAAALAVALVAVMGSAQAAPSTKVFNALVHVKKQIPVETDTLTLTLANERRSKQTLGSAKFFPPEGVTVDGVLLEPAGWDIVLGPDGEVSFFNTSNGLLPDRNVSAEVAVSVDATCGDATWTVRAKQSNDFSGNPGNDFSLNPALSNLRPLGSFTFDQIGTPIGTEFYPQIKVKEAAAVGVTAYDLCGAVKTGYGSVPVLPGNYGDDSTVDRDPEQDPERLAGAVPLELSWANGVGSGTLTPLVVEAADRLVVKDTVTGISANSDAGDDLDDFDVVETICTSAAACHWDNSNKKIQVDAIIEHAGASLGVGFSSNLSTFACNNETDAPLGSTLIYVNPRNYEPGETQSVTFTYSKTLPGTSGPVSAFDLCISKDNGVTGSWQGPIPDCASDPPVSTDPTPCVQDRGRSNGDLVIVLFLDPIVDPLGGIT